LSGIILLKILILVSSDRPRIWPQSDSTDLDYPCCAFVWTSRLGSVAATEDLEDDLKRRQRPNRCLYHIHTRPFTLVYPHYPSYERPWHQIKSANHLRISRAQYENLGWSKLIEAQEIAGTYISACCTFPLSFFLSISCHAWLGACQNPSFLLGRSVAHFWSPVNS